MISSFRQEEIFPSSIDRPLVENTPPPSAPVLTKKKAKTAAPVATPSSFKPVTQPYEDPAPVVPKVELDPQRTTSSLFSDYLRGSGQQKEQIQTPVSSGVDPLLYTDPPRQSSEQPIETTASADTPPLYSPVKTDYYNKAQTDSSGKVIQYFHVPTSKASGTTDTKGISGLPFINTPDYGTAATYDSAEEALANYANVFTETESQREETFLTHNYNNYDPADFARAGYAGVLDPALQGQANKLVSYIMDNDIPLYKEIEGKKYYLTTGSGDATNRLFGTTEGDKNGNYVSYGEVGTYSTVFEPAENILNHPVLQVAAMFVPYGTAVLTAAKGVSGETLHAGDWASLASAGLEKAGYTKAPSTVDGVKDAGKGLTIGGVDLTYAQTNALLKGAITGDPTQAIAETVTSRYLDNILSNSDSSLGQSLDALEMDKDVFADALSNVVGKVANGEDLDDAVLSGFAQYIREDGTFEGNIVPDWLSEAGRDFDDAVLQPIKEAVELMAGGVLEGSEELFNVLKEAGSGVADTVRPYWETIREAGKEFDDDYLHPLEETVEAFGEPIEDAVRALGGSMEEAMQPVKEFLEKVGPSIEDTLRAGGRAFDDYILQPLKDLLEGILKNISLGGIGAGAGGAGGGALLSAGTSSDDLFKFKTQVGVELPEFAEVEYRDPFESAFQSTTV
jgi:hypothetical protein